jgi:hypothetical protein
MFNIPPNCLQAFIIGEYMMNFMREEGRNQLKISFPSRDTYLSIDNTGSKIYLTRQSIYMGFRDRTVVKLVTILKA